MNTTLSEKFPLRFGLVTDLHFGPEAYFQGKLRKLSHQATRLTSQVVHELQKQQLDFLINLGDDIEDESPTLDRERYENCIEILRPAAPELFSVVGNHDLVHLNSQDLLKIWNHSWIQKPYYSFRRRGSHHIVLHSQERKDQDVRIDEPQIAWLQQELEQNPVPTLVFCHHSLADQDLRGNPWFEGHPEICLVRERRVIRQMLSKHGKVRAVFNGHLHWNQLWVQDNIPYITLQSLVENVHADAPGLAAQSYAVVEVREHTLRVQICGAQAYQFEFPHFQEQR